MNEAQSNNGESTLFLPDFCSIRMVFAVVVVGELLAFVIVLSTPTGDRWDRLSLTSLFVQWVALSGALLLCLIRRYLARLGNRGAGAIAFVLLVALTGLLSEASVRLVSSESLHSASHWDFLLTNLAIAAIVSAVLLRYLYVQHQWTRNLQAQSEARLAALQARIRPHFLFNSMNTIASLTRTQPALAEELIEDLSDLFRATMATPTKPVLLATELEHARRYLHIEGLRLGTRLRLSWRLPEPLPEARIPALTLQPLLENAIYHGIEPMAEGGTIEVSASVSGRWLTLSITNPLPGKQPSPRERGNRMALDNIRERLETNFGRTDLIEVHATTRRYEVRVRVPLDGMHDD